MLFLNAGSGKLVNRYSLVHDALEREVYESQPEQPDGHRGLQGKRPDPGSVERGPGEHRQGTGEAYRSSSTLRP